MRLPRPTPTWPIIGLSPARTLPEIGKRLDKIRLDDSNVDDLAAFNPFFMTGPALHAKVT